MLDDSRNENALIFVVLYIQIVGNMAYGSQTLHRAYSGKFTSRLILRCPKWGNTASELVEEGDIFTCTRSTF